MDYTKYFKINKKDSSSNTTLHEAVIKKDPNIVLCLLKKGKADVNSRNRISIINFHKRTPLHLCCQSDDENSLNIEKILIEQPGINVNAVDIKDTTPLHIACKHGNIKSVSVLLQSKDIKVDVLQNGKTPKDIAHEKGFNEIEALIQSHERTNKTIT